MERSSAQIERCKTYNHNYYQTNHQNSNTNQRATLDYRFAQSSLARWAPPTETAQNQQAALTPQQHYVAHRTASTNRDNPARKQTYPHDKHIAHLSRRSTSTLESQRRGAANAPRAIALGAHRQTPNQTRPQPGRTSPGNRRRFPSVKAALSPAGHHRRALGAHPKAADGPSKKPQAYPASAPRSPTYALRASSGDRFADSRADAAPASRSRRGKSRQRQPGQDLSNYLKMLLNFQTKN